MSSLDISNDEVKGSGTDFNSFKYLLRFATSYRKQIIGSLLLLTISSITAVVSARFLGQLVQRGLQEHNARVAYQLGIWVIALEALSVIGTFYGRRILASAAISTILRIRSELFTQLNRLPMSYFDRQPLGRTVTRLTYDVEGLEDFFSGTLARLLSAILSLVVVVTAMLLANWKIGALLILAIVPSVLATYFFRVPVRHWNREFARRNSAINAKLSEMLNGIPVIRSFGVEEWSKRSFDGVVDYYLESAVKTNIVNSWARPITMTLCQLPLLLLIGIGSREVLAGTISLGILVTFIKYCERFSRPISALAQEIHTIQIAFTSAERITTFLKQATEDSEMGKDGALKPAHLRGEIEFRDVLMSYVPGHPVLRKVSFKVQAGECIGLAGATGSGKSTTLALLARLYEYQDGEILVDGRSIRDFDREALRSQIAFVSQDVVIFKGTLRENLSFGPGISDTKLLDAAERSGLLGVMNEARLHLDSAIHDQGANLSVGEKQLIALTRVLIKNPSILILDEATANIDAKIEALVYDAIAKAMQGRSCFIIAHRLATLKSCDRIFLFKNGEIIEEGSHQNLIDKKGYYAELSHKNVEELLNP